MSILVVGSVAFDTIKSQFGERHKILGGAATYFSLAASYFTDVRILAVVGEDFTAEHEKILTSHGIDIRGIEHAKGKTFHWGGEYGDNLNEAQTKFTDLNVFANFQPRIPAAYNDSDFLFLANIQPDLQKQVRDSMSNVNLVGGDTMNYWINSMRPQLMETLKGVDILLINDTEARMLTGDSSVPRAANKILEMGPKALVIKHGEYGATIFFKDNSYGTGVKAFRAPALPIEEVFDPTGAGDSFAGGFMGYIGSQKEITRGTLKHAMFYGGVMGSFAVERFGPERLQNLTKADIDERFRMFRSLTHLE
jgi:sugar/nucleoside kinase (ribokinase family)